MCIAARAGDSIHPGRSLGETVQGGAGGTGGRQRVGVRNYIYQGVQGAKKGGPGYTPGTCQREG